MLIVGQVGCIDSCQITLRDEHDQIIPNLFDVSHIDQAFTYEVCCGDNCCWGTVNVEFKFVPEIECPGPVEITCGAFDQLRNSDFPSVSTCLSSDFEVRLLDETKESLDCHESYTSTATRVYGVIDTEGNVVSECEQVFNILRVDLDNIIYPESVVISCSDFESGLFSTYEKDGCEIPVPWIHRDIGDCLLYTSPSPRDS